MMYFCKVFDPATRHAEYLYLTESEIEDYKQKGYTVYILDDDLVKGYEEY